MSVPKSYRKPSRYDPTDNALDIYDKVSAIFYKVYSKSPVIAYVELRRAMELSKEILEYTTKAVERRIYRNYDVEDTIMYFQKAFDALNALEVLVQESMINFNKMHCNYMTGNEYKEINDLISKLYSRISIETSQKQRLIKS